MPPRYRPLMPYKHTRDPAGDATMDNISKQKAAAARRSPTSHRSSPASTARPRPLTKKHFPFLKLPPELKELVYEHLLVLKHLKIGLLYNRSGKREAIATFSGPIKYESVGEGLFGEYGPAILRVSRLIHNETLPIIYGKNTFFFHNNVAADMFLASMVNLRSSSTVNPGIQYLHHVVISGPKRANLSTTMRDLRILKNLKALVLEVLDDDLVIKRIDDVYPWDDENGLVAAVTQFIDLSASVEERKRQVDKISFAYRSDGICDEDCELVLELSPISRAEVQTRCKALLAELCNVGFAGVAAQWRPACGAGGTASKATLPSG